MKIKNTAKGFALTEVLLAIAVIIIIGIGAYSLYARSRDKAEVTQILSEVVQVQDALQKVFPHGPQDTVYITTSIMKVVDSVGMMPTAFTKNSDGFYVDSNNILMDVNAINGHLGNYYVLINNIPKKICADTAVQLLQIIPQNGYLSLPLQIAPGSKTAIGDITSSCSSWTPNSQMQININ